MPTTSSSFLPLVSGRRVVLLLGAILFTTSAAGAKDAEPASAAVAVGTRLAWHKGNGSHLLWTGFRPIRQGGEVLIQTSAEVQLETRQDTSAGQTIFLLKRCRVIRRTDGLPLETEYFGTPVTRVSLKQRGADLEVVVTLRRPVTAVPRKEAGAAGSWFWVLAFPAGD